MVIQLTLKRQQQVVFVDVPEALKVPIIAIRSLKAKRTCGKKKGKNSVKIDG